MRVPSCRGVYVSRVRRKVRLILQLWFVAALVCTNCSNNVISVCGLWFDVRTPLSALWFDVPLSDAFGASNPPGALGALGVQSATSHPGPGAFLPGRAQR